MFRTGNAWVYSPTDLVDAMECGHRSALRAALAAGVPGVPEPRPLDPLIARQGAAHEHAELQRLRGLFGENNVVCIEAPDYTHTALEEAARTTAEAMRAGAPVIYQGVFYHGTGAGLRFHGRADFLIHTGADPDTGTLTPGPARYEPWDTKLAHHPGPAAALQLAAYAAALERAGSGAPESMHLITGDGNRHRLRTADYTPYLEQVRERLLHRLAHPPALPEPLWGEPRRACEGCGYADLCTRGRAQARHLSLVAGIRTDQIAKLRDAGITTLDRLAEAGQDQRPELLPPHTFTRLREQAALQARQDATRSDTDPVGTVIAEVYSDDGLAMLPEPGPGDMFFDMEGFPHTRDGRGLEYLFGVVTEEEDGTEEFHAFWAHDRAEEKRAFEDFIDFAVARIDAHPGAHIYHYASYEADRLRLLAATFATREAEVDDLLRRRCLVDLYTVVRKSLRVSQRSYSIKYLEPLYLDQSRGAATSVTTATSSIDAYAGHLSAREAGEHERARALLDDIAAYNRDDCVSTARLRDWLERRRAERGITARPDHGDGLLEESDDHAAEAARRRAEIEAHTRALTGPLLEGVPHDPEERSAEQHARALLAALVGYYRREANPAWWDFFRRTTAPLEELEADGECLVPLRVRAGQWQEPAGRRRKARRELELRTDPTRPHPFGEGDQVRLLYPAASGAEAATRAATVTRAEAARTEVVETSDPDDTTARRPAAVLPGAPVRPAPKDTALAALTEQVVAELPDPAPRPALDLLHRRPPRLRGTEGLPDPAGHGGDRVACVIEAVGRLEGSYLAVQGPPGAGKTYLAARLIIHLVQQGAAVGVCSTGHKAIENVLAAACAAAAEKELVLPCAKRPKGPKGDSETPWHQPSSMKDLLAWRSRQGGGYVMGGTAWNFANEAMSADPLDVLIIDEAGQFALADTVAVSAAARDLVLLGDPQQLPQVVQGTHAAGAAASALEHLVGGSEVIDAGRGYFLDQSRRMHPAVCDPVSHLSYRGLLTSHPRAAERALAGIGAGLYHEPVAHTGRSTHSPEEAERVVALARRLVGVDFHEPEAAPRPLTQADIIVVAPFNMQVRAIRRGLAQAGLAEVRVGSVDRFQGQEAPVVLCSMTASSAAEVARGLEFVLSRNRLNVALSRAQVLAVVVSSPDLAAASPGTLAEMRAMAGFAGLCARARRLP